ncbi:MAG: hypothetical protein HQL90_08480 [Magnetococcales bacterium]|nr:hypothetical protein [Magnetococcales bacterium]
MWADKNYMPSPTTIAQLTNPSTARNEKHIVPGSPYKISVAHAAQWYAHVGAVWISSDNKEHLLVNGTDFTVSAGVYTFIAPHEGKDVRIAYSYFAVNVAKAAITEFTGTYPQSPWSHLTTINPAQAIGYQGVFCAASARWSFGKSPSMPNLGFDVVGRLPFAIDDGIYDGNPREILVDLLTNPHYGVGFPAANLGDFAQYDRYCVANGLFLSPVYATQEETTSLLEQLMKLTNSGIYFSEGLLKITPFGDSAATDHGTTFTPDITPVYELTEDDFIVEGSEDPVVITRQPVVDAYNHVQVEFLNSSNQFNEEIVEAKDQVAIDVYGLRTLDPIKAHEIASPAVARNVAQIILQRSQYVRNTYAFKLGWKHCLLEPTDLVTLTDLTIGLNAIPVRILSIEEDENGLLSIEAEDAPPGVSSHAVYPHLGGSGYTATYNQPSGAINTPVMFEAPWALTANGHEIWVAASGGENYGGCQVWLSSDGANYKKIGEIVGPACHGFLTVQMLSGLDPDTVNTCQVDLSESSGVLTPCSVADADNRVTLAWVDGEFIAYSNVTLTGSYQYTLGGYMRRGLHATKITAHAASTQFAQCDGSVFRFAYDPALAGKTVYLKFPAFNQFGGGGQSLADAAEYALEIVGALPVPEQFRVSSGANGSHIFTWNAGGQMPSYFAGYRIYHASGSALDISRMSLLVDGFVTAPFQHNGLSAGDYTFAVVAVNSVGRESPPAFLEAYIADPSIPAAWVDKTIRWSGRWRDLPLRWRDLGPSWRMLAYLAVAGDDYISETIDLGVDRWMEPMVSAVFAGGGSATFKMKTGTTADGGVVGPWRNLAFVGARYIQIQASNTTGPLLSIRIRAAAGTVDVFFNDVNTLTAAEGPAFHRISAGHFSVGTNSDTEVILMATVDAIQGVGPGATWELASKSDLIGGNPAATFKIYDSSLASVDAVIDVTLKTVQKVV